MVHLRPARQADYDKLSQIKRAAMRSRGVTGEETNTRSLSTATLDGLFQEEVTIIVAEADEITGWGCLYFDPEPVAMVFVDPTVDTTDTSEAILERLTSVVEATSDTTVRVLQY